MSRIEQLKEMLEQEPEDTFLRYALAMEYDSQGNSELGMQLYRELMAQDPPHVDSYFRVAQIHVRLGESDEARTTLRKGIELARSQGMHHTAAEMSELLQAIED